MVYISRRHRDRRGMYATSPEINIIPEAGKMLLVIMSISRRRNAMKRMLAKLPCGNRKAKRIELKLS